MQLAPYLPYGLKAEMLDHKIDYVGQVIDGITGVYLLKDIWHFETRHGSRPSIDRTKPILHPLSDLKKPIWHEGKEFVPVEEIRRILIEIDGRHYHFDYSGHDGFVHRLVFDGIEMGVLALPFHIVQKLYELKFDIHGLIDKGLAVEVNTLDTNPYKEGGSNEG